MSAYHAATGCGLRTAAVVNFRGRYTNEVDSSDARDYLDACAAQEVISINPWISQWIFDKAILAVLSDKRFISNLNAEQVEFVARHIPWTRVVRGGITTDSEQRQIELIDYIRGSCPREWCSFRLGRRATRFSRPSPCRARIGPHALAALLRAPKIQLRSDSPHAFCATRAP